MKEREFQNQIVEFAVRYCGWMVMHTRPARVMVKGVETYRTPIQGHKGFPDLVLARNGYRIFAEIKVPPNETTIEQDAWLQSLGPTDGRTLVTVWRPCDWTQIESVLRNPGSWTQASE